MEARDAADITASDLESFYRSVRSQSERLCECLEIEDYGLQSMDDASPIKWHLAHTTWFFEVFILKVSVGYKPILIMDLNALILVLKNVIQQLTTTKQHAQIIVQKQMN